MLSFTEVLIVKKFSVIIILIISSSSVQSWSSLLASPKELKQYNLLRERALPNWCFSLHQFYLLEVSLQYGQIQFKHITAYLH